MFALRYTILFKKNFFLYNQSYRYREPLVEKYSKDNSLLENSNIQNTPHILLKYEIKNFLPFLPPRANPKFNYHCKISKIENKGETSIIIK